MKQSLRAKIVPRHGIAGQLRSDEERTLYARDLAMLVAADTIRTAMDARGVNKTEVARRLGRSKGFVSQLLNGTRNMTLGTLAEFLCVLDQEIAGITIRQLGAPTQRPVETEKRRAPRPALPTRKRRSGPAAKRPS